MSGFGDAVSASVTALDASGSAWTENSARAESLEAKISLLNAEFVDLVTGEGGLKTVLKLIVDFGTGLLKFVSSPIGETIIQITALTSSFFALNTIIKSTIVSGIIKWFVVLYEAIKTATFSIAGFKLILASLNINPVILAITALVSLAVILSKVVKSAGERFEEHGEKLEKATSDYEDAESKIKSLTSALESLNKQIEKGSITGAELDALKEKQALLEQQLFVQQALQSTALTNEKNEAEATAKAYLELDKSKSIFNKTNYDTIESIQSEIEANLSKLDTLDKNSEAYKKLNTETTDLINKRATLVEEEKGAILVGQELLKHLDKNSDTYKKVNEYISKYIDLLERIGISVGGGTEATDQATQSAEEYAQALETLDAQLSALSSIDLSGISDAFDTYAQGLEEVYSAQGLSVDTYKKLIDLGAEYSMYLIDEQGNLRTTADAENALYSAKIDEMAITQARSMIDMATKIAEEGASYADAVGDVQAYTSALWGSVEAQLANAEISDSDRWTLMVQIDAMKKWATQAKANIGTYKSSTSATSSNTSATEKQTDALKEQEDALKDLQDQYETVIDYVGDLIDKDIDKLNEQKDTAIDNIQARIDALNKQKDAEEKFYNDKIDALNESNEAYQDQLDLQEKIDALARARATKVRVYKQGEGFVWTEDASAIAEAEKDLAEFQRELTQKQIIKELEDQRDAVVESLESQIEAQENYSDEVGKEYDKQIDYLKEYKENFDTMVNSYENSQNELMASQLLGADFESQTWQTRIANLQNFANQYSQVLANINTVQAQINSATASGGSSGGGYTSGGINTAEQKKAYDEFVAGYYIATGKSPTTTFDQWLKSNGSDLANLGTGQTVSMQRGWQAFNSGYYVGTGKEASASVYSDWRKNRSSAFNTYATGVASIRDDQMAIVGGEANAELVLGAKLNQGVPMNLGKDTGVVKHDSWAGLLNMINPKANTTNNSNSNSSSITIGNITLPNVKDAQQFVDELKALNMKSYAMQLAMGKA